MKSVIPFIISIIISVNAFSCSCIGESTVKQAIKKANGVFTGTILSKELMTIPDSPAKFSTYFYKYEFLIKQNFKGRISTDTLIIYSGIGNGDCGFKFSVGQSYIVYGYEKSYLDTESNFTGQNIYWTDICTRTVLYNESEVKEIKKYTK